MTGCTSGARAACTAPVSRRRGRPLRLRREPSLRLGRGHRSRRQRRVVARWVDRPMLPALVEQADAGGRDAPARPRPGRRAARPRLRLALRRAVPPRRRTRILAGAGLDPSALRTPPSYPIDDLARDELIRAGRVGAADRDELLRQARGDARDLRAQRLAADGLPRPRTTRSSRRSAATIEEPPARRCRRSPSTAAARRLFAFSLAGLARSYGQYAVAAAGSFEGRVAERSGPIRSGPAAPAGTRPS